MANTRELRRRIKSIKNTSQITKAMQMVAATKMRRAQNQAVGGRPYSENLNQALERLLPQVELEAHPLLNGEITSSTKSPRNDGRVGVILLTTDKGLVGALNTNLIRLVSSLRMQGSNKPTSDSELDSRLRENDVVYYTVGRKGRAFVVRTGKQLLADFENVDAVSFRQAVQLTKLVSEDFLKGEFGEVYLVYPQFVSTLRQEAKRVKLLPISIEDLVSSHPGEAQSASIGSNKKDSIASLQNDNSEFLFEPGVDALLDFILIHHIQTQIYQALLETKASEHSARMVAMKNATDNALELVDDLKLTYNQTRQEAITSELLEITTASLAME